MSYNSVTSLIDYVSKYIGYNFYSERYNKNQGCQEKT